MPKIKLLESRVSLTGSQKAGSVIDIDADTAHRMVGMKQAVYDGDAKKTAKAVADMAMPSINELLAATPPAGDDASDNSEADDEVMSDLATIGLDEKIIDKLIANNLRSVALVKVFIDDDGDLTTLKGIGEATAKKIVDAI